MASQHVLIVGAGICGLSIAHGLQKAGISFAIFDAKDQSTFRPREWTMALHWSVPMLKELLPDDLAARLEHDAVVDPNLDYKEYPNNVLPVVDGVNGELMTEMESGGIRVSRRKLRTLCSEHMNVKFDHRLESVEYKCGSVFATFGNGHAYTGTLLAGADGSRSYVRQHIYPDAEKALFVRKAHPVTALVVHPEACAFISMQDVKEIERPETWVFQLIIMWKRVGSVDGTSEQIHAEVKSRAENLPEPFRSAFLWMPHDVELRRYELGYWLPPTQSWPTRDGRITIAGDAAHSMPPHRGQGLNNAINDAYNLVAAIKEIKLGNQSRVIEDYSLEIAERGGKEVELGLSVAEAMLQYTKFRESALMTLGLKKA